ncbi:heterokaryon incompatibility protein-domain-containing protein [Podospora conica]|nr:heterokaryon incompatibility protein-domain-containing protein [Schizothecium conicum]
MVHFTATFALLSYHTLHRQWLEWQWCLPGKLRGTVGVAEGRRGCGGKYATSWGLSGLGTIVLLPNQQTQNRHRVSVSGFVTLARYFFFPSRTMDDDENNREALVEVTPCWSCETCTAITQLFRTLSTEGAFEKRGTRFAEYGTDICNRLIQAGDLNWKRHGWYVERSIDWTTLGNRAAAGCPTCRLIRDAAMVFISDGDFGGHILAVHLRLTADKPPAVVTIGILCVRESPEIVKVVLYRDPRTVTFLWPMDAMPSHWRNESPDDKISKIKLWMRECLENHVDCKTTRGSMDRDVLLPKRVIDVSPPASAGQDLRLYECSDSEVGTYLCLSHCWGRFQPLQTTRDSLHAWKANIPWAQVPQTFRDAVFVTRRLGFRFLWIDSLCIVQNDKADWEEQAPLMWSIFSNATLTLAATRCGDCRDTLLPQFQRTVHGRSTTGDPIALAAGIRETTLSAGHLNSSYPLLSRAWVFQERLISPRVVHFALDELFWECTSETACECSFLNDIPSGIKSAKYRAGKEPAAGKGGPLQMIWYELVKEYTKLRLTYPSDRHAAIQGLAEEMRHRRKSHYTCGIWHDSLLADLAWCLADDPTQEKEWASADDPIFPSWSWCSVNTGCDYRPFHFCHDCTWEDHEDAKVLNVWAPVSTKSISTAYVSDSIRAGCITLEGRLFDLPADQYRRGNALRLKVKQPGATIFFRPDYDWDLPPDHTEILHVLALGKFRLEGQDAWYSGISLRCVDRQRGLYERLGLLEIEAEDDDLNMTPGSEDPASQPGTLPPWGAGVFGDGRVTTVKLV